MRKSLILVILAFSFVSHSEAATSVMEWTFECRRSQDVRPEVYLAQVDRIVLKVSQEHLVAVTYSLSGNLLEKTFEWTDRNGTQAQPDNCTRSFGKSSLSYNYVSWAAKHFLNFCVDAQMLQGQDGRVHMEYPVGSRVFHSFACE